MAASPTAIVRDSLLGQRLRVSITDGRVVEGVFWCLDAHGNVILRNAEEVTSGSDASTPSRAMGMVLVPHHRMVRCQVASTTVAVLPGVPRGAGDDGEGSAHALEGLAISDVSNGEAADSR